MIALLDSSDVATQIRSYTFGPPKLMILRFKPNGFEGAANLAVLLEEFPAQLSSAFSYGALAHAYVLEEWVVSGAFSPTRARIFIISQRLHERLEALARFIAEVVPHLDACVLVDADDKEPTVKELNELT